MTTRKQTAHKPATRRTAARKRTAEPVKDNLDDIFTPSLSEFDTSAREVNIARRGFPLDYHREAAQLAAYMASDETPPKVKRLISHYLDELGGSTNVGLHTPAVLLAAYPIMRFRDGASDGARVLLGIAINYITDEKERAALSQVWQAERERIDGDVTTANAT